MIKNFNKKRQLSDVEEGELSESESSEFSCSSSESSVFNDGYDSDLIGDEEDRKKLDSMTEKEREEEIYRRTEQRDLLMKRFEMKKKLKQQQKKAAKAERQKQKEDRLKKKILNNKKLHRKNKKTLNIEQNEEYQIHNKNNDNENNLYVDDEIDKDVGNIKTFTNNEADETHYESDDYSLHNTSGSIAISQRRKTNESKRKDTDVSKALANLKADRERKKQQAEDNKQRLEKLQQQQQQKKLRTEDVFSSSSNDEEDNEIEKLPTKKNKKLIKKSDDDSDLSSIISDNESYKSFTSSDDEDKTLRKLISSKEDLNKIKLSRFKIEKWCHAPFFKKVAIGCYVRIGIGLNKGISIYRVAKVIDVVETAKVYQLGTTKTNKGFKLRHGQDERTYRLEFVSNQAFTDEEFDLWRKTMERSDIPLPTMREIEEKHKELQSFVDYRFKDEDYDYIVKEKRKFVKDTDKIVEKKIDLLKRREEAVELNDSDLIKEIDKKIEELNDKANDINSKRSGNFNLLAQINQRNREKSNAVVEEAMKKEFERLKEQKDDPFQRRKVLPTLVTAINKKNNREPKTLPSSQETIKYQQTQNEQFKHINDNTPIFDDLLLSSSKIEKSKNKLDLLNDSLRANSISNPNDLFQAHNFDIKLDLFSAISTNNLQPAVNNINLISNTGALSRRALNLDDYKRKKGLI